MTKFTALRWYQKSIAAMLMIDLPEESLRRLGMTIEEIEKANEITEQIDNDVKIIMNAVQLTLIKECKKYIPKPEIVRTENDIRKNKVKYGVSLYVGKNKKSRAQIGITLDLDKNNRPSLLIWIYMPNRKIREKLSSFEKILSNANNEAQLVWSNAKNYYLLDSILLRKSKGAIKKITDINNEVRKKINLQLTKGESRSLIAKIIKAAK